MSNEEEHKTEGELRQLKPLQLSPSSYPPRIRRRWSRRFRRRTLAALGVIATILTLLSAADGVAEKFDLLSPEIIPDPAETAASSSPFLLFSIRNNSKLADFYHVEVGCNFHVQVFRSEKYRVVIEGKSVDPGFDPKDRDVTLRRGRRVTFPCDPAMEPVPPSVAGELLRNSGADLYVSVKYAARLLFFDWPRTIRSPVFHCVNPGSGLRCTEAEAVQPDLPIMPPRN